MPASPFFRTMKTARLMMGRATPKTDMREREGAEVAVCYVKAL